MGDSLVIGVVAQSGPDFKMRNYVPFSAKAQPSFLSFAKPLIAGITNVVMIALHAWIIHDAVRRVLLQLQEEVFVFAIRLELRIPKHTLIGKEFAAAEGPIESHV